MGLHDINSHDIKSVRHKTPREYVEKVVLPAWQSLHPERIFVILPVVKDSSEEEEENITKTVVSSKSEAEKAAKRQKKGEK
jgi:hypothetical protein